jgi:hypothetical protein
MHRDLPQIRILAVLLAIIFLGHSSIFALI